MAEFEYDLGSSTALTVLRSKIRFEIDDTVVDSGPRPGDKNFSNAEIDYWLDTEGDHVMRTVAAACESLSRIWSRFADTVLGPHEEKAAQISRAYVKRAEDLRTDYGWGSTTARQAFSVGMLPSDPSVTTGEYSV